MLVVLKTLQEKNKVTKARGKLLYNVVGCLWTFWQKANQLHTALLGFFCQTEKEEVSSFSWPYLLSFPHENQFILISGNSSFGSEQEMGGTSSSKPTPLFKGVFGKSWPQKNLPILLLNGPQGSALPKNLLATQNLRFCRNPTEESEF